VRRLEAVLNGQPRGLGVDALQARVRASVDARDNRGKGGMMPGRADLIVTLPT
jgi:hypothetical protein